MARATFDPMIFEAVKRGAALLDANGPTDWRERVIDSLDVPEDLDMGNYWSCIIGRVYGIDPDAPLNLLAYERALVSLGIAPSKAGYYGFDLDRSRSYTAQEADRLWEDLRDAWILKI